jgi:putative NADPH-quinone reductase
MRISVILAHPTPGSFNHAIARTIVDTLAGGGHDVLYHDLYAERFDPVLPSDEIAKDAVLPPVVEQHCREICVVDGIAIVHPNYWSAPPAILRGWVDRVLRAGRAYEFVEDGKGGAEPKGLLKAKVGLVFNTANTPQAIEEQAFGDPLQTHWLKVVFGLCGVPTIFRRNFAPVITSTPDERGRWLGEVQAAVAQHFPPKRPA